MPAPAELRRDAVKLAKLARGLATNPFSRRNNGHFAFMEMAQREGTLAAVADIYCGLFGMYRDPQAEQRNRPEEYNDQPGRIAINLTKLFVDLLAVSYAQAPTRVYYRGNERVEDNDPIVDALNKVTGVADINQMLKRVDCFMRLFGNVVVRPVWDEDNAELVYHIYPGYCVRVIENVRNPRKPWATVLMGERLEMANDGATERVPTAEVWLPDAMLEMTGSTITGEFAITGSDVRYDFSPLVHCFDSIPFGGKGRYYVESIGWQLSQQNVRLNEDYFSQYGFAVLMQSIGITIVKGQLEGSLVISPGRAVHFPDPDDGSGLQSLAQGASLPDFQEAIKFMVDTLRESYGIPAQMLTADVASSGQAIIQANAPIAELRKARQPIFDRIETDLLRATLQELRGRAEGFDASIDPMEWDVAVVYDEPMVAQSVSDKVLHDQHLISIGVLTAGEIAMREKPGQFDTVEDAEEWVAENAAREAEKRKAEMEASGLIEGGEPGKDQPVDGDKEEG